MLEPISFSRGDDVSKEKLEISTRISGATIAAARALPNPLLSLASPLRASIVPAAQSG